MSLFERLQSKLASEFAPQHLEVINESHQHNVPENSETHFKVILVSQDFEGVSPVQRHQKIFACVKAEQDDGIHALSLKLYTPEEWGKAGGEVPASPKCLGGSKS